MKKIMIKRDITDFIVYSLIPILLFALIYKLANLKLNFLIITSILSILINLIYLLFRLNSIKNEVDYYEKFKVLEEEYKELGDTFYGYKSSLEEYYINWIHQMKTPITALKLVVNGENDLNELKNKNLINEEIIYIEDYTKMALSYLKLLDTDKNLDFTYIKLHSIIKELIKKYRILFIQYKTRLIYEEIDDEVLTDPNWTTIIIEQLLNNALKYSKGKTIKIYYIKEEKRLVIEDTGIGIRPQDISRIWDKGFSGLNGRVNEESSGLGLFLVKNISNRLNQRVSVTSEFGQGSKFSIYFNTENKELE